MGKEQRPHDKQSLAYLGDSKEDSVARAQRVNSRDFGVEVIDMEGHHRDLGSQWKP